MTYLVSHLWLLYLISVVLAGIAYLVIDQPGVDILVSAAYAAIPDLIAVCGLWYFQNGNMIPAVMIAVLCCFAAAAAVWLFWATCKNSNHLPAKAA